MGNIKHHFSSNTATVGDQADTITTGSSELRAALKTTDRTSLFAKAIRHFLDLFMFLLVDKMEKRGPSIFHVELKGL